jgi:hypothetical protein
MMWLTVFLSFLVVLKTVLAERETTEEGAMSLE